MALGEEKWRVLEEQAWIKRIREIIHEFGQFFDEDIAPLRLLTLGAKVKYTNTVKMLVGDLERRVQAPSDAKHCRTRKPNLPR